MSAGDVASHSCQRKGPLRAQGFPGVFATFREPSGCQEMYCAPRLEAPGSASCVTVLALAGSVARSRLWPAEASNAARLGSLTMHDTLL